MNTSNNLIIQQVRFHKNLTYNGIDYPAITCSDPCYGKNETARQCSISGLQSCEKIELLLIEASLI